MESIGLFIKAVSSAVILSVMSIGSYFYHPSKLKQENQTQQSDVVIEEFAVSEEDKGMELIESDNEQEKISENIKKSDGADAIMTKANTVVEAVKENANKKSDKKKNEEDDKKEKDSTKDTKSDQVKPEPCFSIADKNKYAENVYYTGSLVLDATCSKDTNEYQWYFNGSGSKSGQKTTFYSGGVPRVYNAVKSGTPVEIKLIVTSKDGLSASTTKTVSFREIPKPEVCFNPKSAEVKELEIGKEIDFDASCTTFSDENPVTKYIWKFRDSNATTKEGKKVSHSFSDKTSTAEGGGCNNGLLEVELDIETKLGTNSNNLHHFCIKKTVE